MATSPQLPQPVKMSTGGGSVSIESNVAVAVMAAINYELAVVWHGLASEKAKQSFYEKIFPVLKKGLGEYVDAKASTNPQSLHHVYEWGAVGQPSARLWDISKNKTTDGFKIKYKFKISRRVAPIDPILKKPGTSGKFVSKSQIFKNKAIVMEFGQPVIVKRKAAKYLAIPQKNFNPSNGGRGIIFSKGPIMIRNSGGTAVKLSFTNTFNNWFKAGQATKYLKASGALKSFEERTTKAGKRIPAKIKKIGIKGSISSAQIDALAAAAVAAGG